MMHKNYLEKHKRVLFCSLLAQGKLYQHCADVEKQANEMYDIIVEQLKESEGVTEKLKENNQWEWIRKINNIQQRAREVVCTELIYT